MGFVFDENIFIYRVLLFLAGVIFAELRRIRRDHAQTARTVYTLKGAHEARHGKVEEKEACTVPDNGGACPERKGGLDE